MAGAIAGVDCVRNEVNCRSKMEESASNPLQYVIAFENGSIPCSSARLLFASQPYIQLFQNTESFQCRDVTAKYAHEWLLESRKVRADESWWRDVTSAFESTSSERKAREDLFVRGLQEQAPMPKTVQEFKNHPLYNSLSSRLLALNWASDVICFCCRYVLERHLLKFEALYPSDVTPVGYVKKEAVYRRENVHTLHSRETWLKDARMVRVSYNFLQLISHHKT